jgi:hypothetical protein
MPPATTTLTKREYFAALAMQGLLANPEVTRLIPDAEDSGAVRLTSAGPSCAVEQADALIAELAKEPT